MSIDTRYLESGARIRPGSPPASPSTSGQSDTSFAKFLSAADSRAATKPESIAPQVNDKALLQRRSDESAQARRQVEPQREARSEGSASTKPADKTADDAEPTQAVASTGSDPANKPGMRSQRSAENRDLAPKAQGRGPRDPQEAKAQRDPQAPDQADASQAGAPAGAQTRSDAAHGHRGGQSAARSASAKAPQAHSGTDSAAAQADTLQTTDSAHAALPESASASLEAVEGRSEDDKACIARKKLTADQAESNAAIMTVATNTLTIQATSAQEASVAGAAQTMVTAGPEKSDAGKSELNTDKPAINKTSETGDASQTIATGAPANGDAIAAGAGAELGASPETNVKSGHGAARASGAGAGAGINAALRDAQSADAASAIRSSASDNARPLSDKAAMSPPELTGRPQAIGAQESTPVAALADQGMVPPGGFAGLLRSAEASGEFRSEGLARAQTFPITVPFDDPRFSGALSERVQWLVREGIQSAELTLHPQDMGPIRIEMSIDGTAASIDFAATQADTRAAIEQSLPRLRDLLADQGLQLGGTKIGADTSRQDNPGSRARQSGGTSRTATVDVPDATSDGVPVSGMSAPRRNAAGRIDLFA